MNGMYHLLIEYKLVVSMLKNSIDKISSKWLPLAQVVHVDS